jgi:predicted metal-dependent hydrolase
MSLFKARYADGQKLELDGIPVRLKVSPRARRVSLRIHLADREAVAVAPSRAMLGEAVRFARERNAWLRARLASLPQPAAPLELGDRLEVLGEVWRLQPDGRRPVLRSPDGAGARALTGCGAGLVDPGLVRRAVRREAEAVFLQRARTHCAVLGAPVPPIRLIDARTRWGSCTPAHAGRPASIRLSWRLALAPLAVADYVVAHECAHLLEANHGPRFWALVERLFGPPRSARAWLKTNGARLHERL